MLRMGSAYAKRLQRASTVNRMQQIPGAWRRTAAGAGLVDQDGAIRPTIFAEMSALAARTGAINLGQGFPDEDGPAAVLDVAREAIANGVNQYPPGRGMPDLLHAIADHQQRFYGIALDPHRDVIVTAGATEALAAAVLALVDGPDDEVVVFEPYYDSYAAAVALSGARLVTVPLRWPDFQPDLDELAAAVSDRTRIILVNDPHNPTGAVFTDEVRREVVRLAERHDATIVTDEVYEHLVFDAPHVPIATLPGAWGRTLSISSGGKTFSTTGWKIGWISGPAPLVDAVLAVKQFLTYVNGAPFQPAIATGLRLPDDFYTGIAETLRAKRDLLGAGLRAAGFAVSVPQGSYFTVADAANTGATDASAFCRELPDRAGVVAIPLTAFTTPARRAGVRDTRAIRRLQARRGARGGGCPPRAARNRLGPAPRDDREAAQPQRRVDPTDPLDGIPVEMGDGDSGPRADCGELDPLRVDDHRESHPERGRMIGRRDEQRVLDRPGVNESAPVVLLQRPAHPLGRYEHDIRPRVREQPAHFGEAQVVARHETEDQSVERERLGRGDGSRLDPVGLALTERVVQVQLAVGREQARRVHRDDGVADAALIAAFEEPRDDVDVVRRRERREPVDERAVDVLRVGGERLVERVDEVARVLGQHDEACAAAGCLGHELRDDREIRAGIGGRGELAHRDGDRRRRGHSLSLSEWRRRMTVGMPTHKTTRTTHSATTDKVAAVPSTTTSKTNATTPMSRTATVASEPMSAT